ncbi:MAG: hypothetical protein RMJ07_01265 [Nitrososphaerota archaeon]|nr:hypothetical protein [Candidatus Bathyarchaeota archaeon]MDW8048302.1 hypothetical protein [Nitrososphaerota archaeon]
MFDSEVSDAKDKPKESFSFNRKSILFILLFFLAFMFYVVSTQLTLFRAESLNEGPFDGYWRSPYLIKYYSIDPVSGERWTEYEAYFCLIIEHVGSEVYVEQGWVEIKSFRLAPNCTLGPNYPPQLPLPHPRVAGAYYGPTPFYGTYLTAEFPGGTYNVTVNGTVLIFEDTAGTSRYKAIFNLTKDDPQFGFKDVIRVTYPNKEKELPNVIVLVKQ